MAKNTVPHVSIIKSIATATAATAPPSSLPILGSGDITWGSGWAEIGAYYGDGDLGFEFEDDRVEIAIPEIAKALDLISFRRGLKSITIPIAEIGETAVGLDSGASVATNVVSFTPTTTFKAVAIEIRHTALIYAARCDIRWVGASGGFKSQTGIELEVTAIHDATYPNGFRVHRFNGVA